MRKPAVLLLGVALVAAVSLAAAQSQPPPIPEKKKPRKVWTNEDLSGLGGGINVVGQEAPPAPEAKPAAAPAPDYTWVQLDALRETRTALERDLANNRQAIENLNEEYRKATDPGRIDAILEARAEQEQRVANLGQQLQQVNTDLAVVEKLTKGKKRPAKLKPAAPPAAPAGESAPAGEQPPAEKPPAQQPPPPPPPPSV